MGTTDRMRNTVAMENRSEKSPTMRGEKEAIPIRMVKIKPSVSSLRLDGIISINKVSDNPEWPEPKVPSSKMKKYINQKDVEVVKPKMEIPQRMYPPTSTGFRLPIRSISPPMKGRKTAPERDINPYMAAAFSWLKLRLSTRYKGRKVMRPAWAIPQKLTASRYTAIGREKKGHRRGFPTEER